MRINTAFFLVLLAMLLPLDALAHGGAKKTVEATGIVHRVNSENATLNITANPIKKLSWSETTMDWKVAENVKINHLSAGDHVKFLIKQTNSRLTYHITHIEIIN